MGDVRGLCVACLASVGACVANVVAYVFGLPMWDAACGLCVACLAYVVVYVSGFRVWVMYVAYVWVL